MRRGLAVLATLAGLASTACVPPAEWDPDLTDLPQVTGTPQVLIYSGTGSWPPEVRALRTILLKHGAGVRLATSDWLEGATNDELAAHRLMIFPGGNSITMAGSMSASTRRKIRDAVQLGGVSYLGFCAGAWAAIAGPEPATSDLPDSFQVASARRLEKTSLQKSGHRIALVEALLPGGGRPHLLWYGGPITPELPGGVLARYPDGTAAISQIRSGKGLVLVSGLHPALSQGALAALGFSDPDDDEDIAWALLSSGITGRPLPAF